MATQPTILICGEAATARRAARRVGQAVGGRIVTAPDIVAAVRLLGRRRPAVVVLTETREVDVVQQCRQIKRLHGPHTPVLVVTSPAGRRLGIRCLQEVADSLHVGCVGSAERRGGRGGRVAVAEADLTADAVPWSELAARVQALVRSRRRHDTLVRQCHRLDRQRRHIEAIHARLDQELLLAQKLQRSFLPQRLPEVGAVRFAARFFAVGPVGGDIYDVTRLDEYTVSFYVADAVGHGVAAALLTAFVKKAIRPKLISGHSYQILSPGEVLTALNREMLGEELHESSFVTMAYGTIDARTHVLRYSLAGHPPGILVGTNGRQQLLDHSGPLLGVMEDAYPTQTVELSAGDKVVFYSDGVDEARTTTGEVGPRALCQGVARHAHLPVDQMLDEALREILPVISSDTLRDDLTLMALEVRAA